MKRPIVTILLAPSGAGKTTRVRNLQKNGLDLVHIDRDCILGELIKSNLKDGPLVITLENRLFINELWQKAKRRYFARLEEEIQRGTAHIVIDHPPENAVCKWVYDTIRIARTAGRKIEVEGIAAEPQMTLARVLKRDTEGWDLSCQTPNLMQQDRDNFHNWLATYRNFPAVFPGIAQIADEARLYDGNGSELKLVAEWKTGNFHILNSIAYAAFKRLEQLNRVTADFEVTRTETNMQEGRAIHSFHVKTKGFYGPEAMPTAFSKASGPTL